MEDQQLKDVTNKNITFGSQHQLDDNMDINFMLDVIPGVTSKMFAVVDENLR